MKKLLLTAALTAMISSAFAATPALPKVLELPVQRDGMVILDKFEAANSWQGWVVQRGARPMILYTSPDGKYLMVGALVDEAGKNLTAEYAEKYIPKPDINKLYGELEKSAVIVEGAKDAEAKGTIYAFMDPNCIFCHLAWKAFLPYEKAGLQVRWVPVGFLKPDSMGKAAALLESANAEQALTKHETEFEPQTETGGITPVAKVSPETAKKLAANSKLMGDFGITGTPGIVFKDKAGKVTVLKGMPRLSDLPGITGIPEQPQTDPDLERFK